MSRNPIIARLPATALAACLLLLPSTVWAERSDKAGGASNAKLDKARKPSKAQELYDDQEYEAAIKAAEAKLSSSATLRPARIAALRVKAATLAVLGRDAQASKTYEKLLDLAPDFRLPTRSSPRIRGVFGSAQARWQVRREGALAMKLGAAWTAIKLSVQLPLDGRGGRALVVNALLTDPQTVAHEVALFYRRVGSKRYATVSVKARAGSNSLTVPAAVTASAKAYQLELYLQVVHASGITLRRYGRASAPRRLLFRAGHVPKPPPITKRWWFWTAVATVVLSVPILVDRMRDVGPQGISGRLP